MLSEAYRCTNRWIPGLLKLPASSPSLCLWALLIPPTCPPSPSPRKPSLPGEGPEHPSHWLSCASEALIVHSLWCHHCAHGARAPGRTQSGHRAARANSRIESLVMAGEMPGASTADVQAPRLGARRSEAQTSRASVHTPGCRVTSVPSLWA